MSALPEHIALRDQINRGEIFGPRLILNRMIDGIAQSWPPPINTPVSTPEEARQVVLESKEAGYDGMKVYSFLNQECYDAILETAQAVDLPVRGHIPDALSVEHVVASGQNLIAHAEEVMKHARGDYSPEKIEYFAEIIANSNSWISPTLTTSRKILALFDDLDAALSPTELCYLHPMLRGIWSYLVENMYLKIPVEHQQFIRKGFKEFQIPFTRALHENNARLMTGTDVLIPSILPGFSIFDELKELEDIGLTPYQALKTATTHPMEYLGELNSSGTIEIGKLANLILVDGNPLQDISNAKKVMGVLVHKQWVSQEEIQSKMDMFYQ